MNTSDWWLVAFLCALAIVALLAPRVLAALVGDRDRAGANLSGVFPGVPVVVAVLALIVGWGIFESGTPGPFGPLLPFAVLLLYLPALRLGRGSLALVALVLTPLSLLALHFLSPATLNFLVALLLALASVLILLTHERPVTEASKR
ncbi:hypothetical protein Ocepr_0217 [Oceanithermus profundus DSM 14977]|uniref:Uncharacterized protein n=1 Tax=Oceanithermus profundus (strain DSM 14977 / NBRC 100410 / VKM B-2274 / 506) TaxID=670487 RepID=E4U6J3_OCEP5|nr:hypothetical protein [Oceanithermus profundus]ADR35679.1 hypothetical protein Ocepr_0217 [Oceanithermus profundus DSM 14977]